MTTSYLFLFALVCLGLIAGVILQMMWEDISSKDNPAGLSGPYADKDPDVMLLDYLEKSECNLYFNVQMGSWGLLDGNDSLIATGQTVRSTLARAILNDKAEVANARPL